MATLKTNFGEFKGKAGDGVVQYLGVKYATLKDRLATPVEIESYGSDVVDATQFGYVDSNSLQDQCSDQTTFPDLVLFPRSLVNSSSLFSSSKK